MSPFASGSAWAMARDISNGHLQVTDRTFARMSRPEIEQLSFELDRHTRELRGEQAPLDDTGRIRTRNQRLMRLTRGTRMIQQWKMGNNQ